jgi:hypothetical protein
VAKAAKLSPLATFKIVGHLQKEGFARIFAVGRIKSCALLGHNLITKITGLWSR